MTDHKCNRCGAELKIVEVRVPVPYPTSHTFSDEPPKQIGDGAKYILHRYETREDVADCERCTGGY